MLTMGKCCDGDGQGCHVTAVLGGNLIDKQAGADRLLVWRPISKPPSLLSRLVLSPAAACRSPTHKTFRSIDAPFVNCRSSTTSRLRSWIRPGLPSLLSVVSFLLHQGLFIDQRSRLPSSPPPSPSRPDGVCRSEMTQGPKSPKGQNLFPTTPPQGSSSPCRSETENDATAPHHIPSDCDNIPRMTSASNTSNT